MKVESRVAGDRGRVRRSHAHAERRLRASLAACAAARLELRGEVRDPSCSRPHLA